MAEGTQTLDVPAFSFTSAITLCVDFKNPHSYFAKGSSYELESDFDLHIDWQPLLVAPMTRPTTRVVDENRGIRHRRMRAEYYEKPSERRRRKIRQRINQIRKSERQADKARKQIKIL